jgi:hypothetical protein
MTVLCDILDESTKVKGEIGELIVSGYLKKKGFEKASFNLASAGKGRCGTGIRI